MFLCCLKKGKTIDEIQTLLNIYFQIARVTTKRMGIVCTSSDIIPKCRMRNRKKKNSMQKKEKKEKKKKKQKQRDKQKAHVILIYKGRL